MAHTASPISHDKPMSALRWIARGVVFVWSAFLLAGMGAEAASGYPPSGSVTGAALNFTVLSVALVAAIISIWWDWLGGTLLIAVGLIDAGTLLAGAYPETPLFPSLILTGVTIILPGALLLLARQRTPRHALA